jgi:hypothetical protein
LTNPETSDNTVTFSVKGESRCAALWGTNDRSSGAGAGSIPFTELPKTFYVEGLYPNSLDANGEIAGSVDFKGECTIGGSKSTTIAKKRYYLEANCTFYTVPYEIDDGYNYDEDGNYTTDSLTTVTVYVEKGSSEHHEYSFNSEFLLDVKNAGTGKIKDAVNNCRYIKPKSISNNTFYLTD